MKKKMSILALTASMALCAGVGFGVMTPVKAENVELTANDFCVIGASVRIEGIRFGVGVEKATYDAMEEAGTLANLQNLHLLVMPSALVNGELEIGETYTSENEVVATAKDCELGSRWVAQTVDTTEYMISYVYIHEIDKNYYDVDLTIRAYYQEAESTPIYSEELKRSYMYVADAALNDLSTVQDEVVYKNAVGSSFSPYDQVTRGALLGVRYNKIGGWDLVDGKLVQTTANVTDYISDKTVEIPESGEYYLTTSFKVGSLAETTGNFGGFHFLWNPEDDSYIELDYRIHTGLSSEKLFASLRVKDKTGWRSDGYYGGNTTNLLNPSTWYDFLIYVNKTDENIKVRVSYRETGTDADFKELVALKTIPVGTTAWGQGTRFYSGRAYGGHACSTDFSNDYVVRVNAGATVTSSSNGLHIANPSTSGANIVDLKNTVNNSGNNANFTLEVDLVWDNPAIVQSTGFKVGGYLNDLGNIAGAQAEIYIKPGEKKIWIYNGSAWKTPSFSSLTDVCAKIANKEAVTWKIEVKTSGTATTVNFYLDGHFVATVDMVDNTKIYSTRIQYVAKTGVTFSNLKTY